MNDLVVFDGAKISGDVSMWPGIRGIYLDPAKAAQILGKMTRDQAAAILGSSKMENWTAGSILSNMETSAAVEIVTKMDTGRAAEIMSSIYPDAGAKIVSAMTTDQAVKILSSDKMNPKWSAYILTQVKTETAVAILTAMDKGVAATIFSGMDTAAAATIAGAMEPAKAAAIFANDKFSVDDASRILYGMDATKAAGILQQLDLVNSAKSADLRAKLGIGSNDISKMLPEVAAEFLSKMDPAKAAAELIKLDREAAGAILASLKLSAEQTAKIFEAMEADKAATIMSSSNYRNANYDKTAEVFDKMSVDAAVKILTSANMDKNVAASLLDYMSTEAAVKIVSKMDVNTAVTFMNMMHSAAAGKVLAGLDVDFAVNILNNPDLGGDKAGYMLNWAGAEAAANILTKLAAIDNHRAAAILYYSGYSNAYACAEIVNALSTDVAAKIFTSVNMHAETAALVLSMDKISVEKASEILSKVKATDAQKVTDILANLDGINLAKSDQIREKIGLAVDISTMTPEAAAEYLSKLDPAVAAAKLAKLAADKAADIMFSSKMTLDAAAKIFNNLTADQAAEILTAQYAGGVNGGSNALPRSIGGINADELLAAMDPAKAGAILGSSKLEAGMAAKIVVTMNTDTAISILGTMDPKKAADILSTQKIVDGGNALNPLISSAQAAEILAGMGTDKAAAIMNNMNAGYAALIVNALTEDDALKILGAMDAAKIAGILLAQDDNGPVSPANHKTWDVISADKAASLLGKLDPLKAAKILGALPADGTKAASIIASTKFDNKAAANVLAAMDPAKAAAILTYCKIERSGNSRTVYPPAISREKSAAILQAMSLDKAAAIIGGFTTLDLDYAIVGGEILSEMPADTAARLINRIPAAGGKTKTEVQAALLSKMSHVIVANILNSRFMTVHKAAKILNTLGRSDSARVTLFINELAKINKNKAGNIFRHLDLVERRIAG
jgi:flagellar motility protein MotE (MotC chaperone)